MTIQQDATKTLSKLIELLEMLNDDGVINDNQFHEALLSTEKLELLLNSIR